MREIVRKIFFVYNPVQFVGLEFPNRMGLAAGFDKNARYLRELSALGFGSIEIGTVTPVAQPGNEKPRLFRLLQDRSIINRMGFNNEGVDAAVRRLQERPQGLVIGGNIGKNKVTPNELAVQDYMICFEKLYDHVDYFVVNVSSPNTPGLRELQDKEPLTRILTALMRRRELFVSEAKPLRPVLLKIAPDLTNTQLDDVIDIVGTTGIDGLVATNTTIGRDDLTSPEDKVQAIGAGGLSGEVLAARANEVVAYINERSTGTIPLIGVGGIHNEITAAARLKAGATLLQIYTAFIFEGPALVKKIARMERTGKR